jgi:hypothetical protein
MSDHAPEEPADAVGDIGNGPDDPSSPEPEAEPYADLMRADTDPLPDAQVPGIGPDGSAPNTPA